MWKFYWSELDPAQALSDPTAHHDLNSLNLNLVWVRGALGHHLLPLPGHQVKQLVDQEGGGQGGHPTHLQGCLKCSKRGIWVGLTWSLGGSLVVKLDITRWLQISTSRKTYQNGYQFQQQVKLTKMVTNINLLVRLTGIVINSRHTGHRNCESRAKVATILVQDNFC